MGERLIMERLVRGKAPGRDFDIEFWQTLGPTQILQAAWDLVVTAASVKGIDEDQLRLQRSVAKLEHGAAVLGREDLIASKQAAGRPQDKLDIQTLLTPRMSRKPAL